MLNLIAYAIFLPVSGWVTIRVGWLCYQHGKPYLLALLPDAPEQVPMISNLLLMGYYLVNLGYIGIVLRFWITVHSVSALIESVCWYVGLILTILALLHYTNLGFLALFRNLFTPKNTIS